MEEHHIQRSVVISSPFHTRSAASSNPADTVEIKLIHSVESAINRYLFPESKPIDLRLRLVSMIGSIFTESPRCPSLPRRNEQFGGMMNGLLILGFFFIVFFSIRLLNEKKDCMLTYLRSIGLLV